MKIAVIGAGFSGMYAAYLLEKKGHNVVLYEKRELLGGHCRTLVGKNSQTELGTAVFFSNAIKELLLELQLDYSSRLNYRNFLDEDFNSIEYITKENASVLVDEFARMKELIGSYACLSETKNYGYIHPDLLLPIDEFLKNNNLQTIMQILSPLLSAYGFGDIQHVQAYYALHAFDQEILRVFIEGDKFSFITDGTSALIDALNKEISCIRLSQEVTNISPQKSAVLVETPYEADLYDKVLVTAKLRPHVIKEPTLNHFMEKVETNPFFTCIYQVDNKRLAATYYNNNLGKKERVQFFRVRRQNHKTTLIAYAYGLLNKNSLNQVTSDLKSSGVSVNHLITTKQWHIFPHIKPQNLTPGFYEDLLKTQKENKILFAGSLVSKPELGNLYLSVKESVDILLSTK